jgi:hypothetical protein
VVQHSNASAGKVSHLMFMFLSPGLFGFIAIRRLRRTTLFDRGRESLRSSPQPFLLLLSTASSQSSELHAISSGERQVLETDRQNANCRECAGVVTPCSNSVPVLNEGFSQPILSSAASGCFSA